MNTIYQVLALTAETLSEYGCRFALVGGLAVSVRVDPRFTKDVDLAVKVETDAEAEALVHFLVRSGFAILATLEQSASGRLATIRLQPPGPHNEIIVDLLFASSGIESEVVSGAEVLEIAPGLHLPVADPVGLIAMKLLSADPNRRPNDIADLQGLAGLLSKQSQVDQVRYLLSCIGQRQASRERDLQKAMDEWVLPWLPVEGKS